MERSHTARAIPAAALAPAAAAAAVSIVHIMDLMWSTNSAAIALHVFLWIILNFPAIE